MPSGGERRSLQDLVDETPNLVEYFYNETLAPHYRARTSLTAAFIPPEFTNWRDEQRAWRETAILFDQSHHMPELFLKGPDALRLLERLGINTFSNFSPSRAKQFVACTPGGHVIGDCIAYCHGDNDFELVSGMPVHNWVQFQAEKGGYDVSIERDDPTPYNPKGRRILYRFQLEGPRAGDIFREVVDGELPEIPFFRTAHVRIRGHNVLVLRHGMAGHSGVEISGPYDEMDAVRKAVLEAGEKYGLVQGGTKTYFSTIFEFGWMPYPLPGIYTGEALEKIAEGPRRSKVTLVWNREDVLKVFASQFGDGPRYKALDFPVAYFGWPQFDEVRAADARLVGLSCHCGYSGNEGEMLSLAMMNEEFSAPGTRVTLIWGEPDGGSRKPHVERHQQLEIRATVAPVPYARSVREMKRAAIGQQAERNDHRVNDPLA